MHIVNSQAEELDKAVEEMLKLLQETGRSRQHSIQNIEAKCEMLGAKCEQFAADHTFFVAKCPNHEHWRRIKNFLRPPGACLYGLLELCWIVLVLINCFCSN